MKVPYRQCLASPQLSLFTTESGVQARFHYVVTSASHNSNWATLTETWVKHWANIWADCVASKLLSWLKVFPIRSWLTNTTSAHPTRDKNVQICWVLLKLLKIERRSHFQLVPKCTLKLLVHIHRKAQSCFSTSRIRTVSAISNLSPPASQYPVSLCPHRFHQHFSLMGGIWPLGQVDIQHLLDPHFIAVPHPGANTTHNYCGPTLHCKF